MLDRFERPLKIICLAMAVLLVWQLGYAMLSRNPLKNLKIPALPALPESTNQPAKAAATNGTNVVRGTNAVKGTHVIAKSTNSPAGGEAKHSRLPKSGPPDGMMGGGMPGGRRGGGLKKLDLPPEVQARVDKIIDSELFGPVIRPMPMALLGIADQEAFIQATNGQTGSVKIGGEIGGIKLLRIGVNRVLVEQDGEKQELTLFDGIGGESLMPKTTNAPATKAPAKIASPSTNASTNRNLSSKQKETP